VNFLLFLYLKKNEKYSIQIFIQQIDNKKTLLL
jgi:hypothetical protein